VEQNSEQYANNILSMSVKIFDNLSASLAPKVEKSGEKL
jgi:hypothetical protein